MTDLNSVSVIGRVVKDAVITQYANDLKVANFTIVVNRDRKNGEQWEEKSIFIDLALFGKSAESYVKYLTKGKVVSVEGHLDMDKWEKDDKKYSKLKVVADRINPFIAGSKKNDNGPADAQVPEFSENCEDFAPPQDGAIF